MKSSNRQMLSQNADNLIDLFLCGILNYEIMETHLGGIMMDAIFSNYSPVFLYVNRYSFSDNWVYHESRVPYSLVRYICSGSARFEVDGDGYDLRRGASFISRRDARLTARPMSVSSLSACALSALSSCRLRICSNAFGISEYCMIFRITPK